MFMSLRTFLMYKRQFIDLADKPLVWRVWTMVSAFSYEYEIVVELFFCILARKSIFHCFPVDKILNVSYVDTL
jgi:hypothetical protein